MKARGLAAACRAAETTSSAGASLPTKAEAPESSAAKSLSSPAYIVSTTMPSSGSLCRARWRQRDAVAVRQLDVGDEHVRRSRSSASTAAATEAASPTTSRSPARSKALRRPSRMSWWSSTSST